MMTSANIRAEHRYDRIGWLRAAVLGANDGIITISTLIFTVASAPVSTGDVRLVGLAGLLSGVLAMAAGEYVSVKSQADAEAAELDVERRHLTQDFDAERRELAAIYQARGLEPALADEVARQLMAHDALGAHARDELGFTDTLRARPVLAAMSSGASFAAGGAVPLLAALVCGAGSVRIATGTTSLVCLALLGGFAAHAGGASRFAGALRVVFWGVFAMAIAGVVGRLLGTAIAL